jgi:hypothetical protein
VRPLPDGETYRRFRQDYLLFEPSYARKALYAKSAEAASGAGLNRDLDV